MSIKKSMLLFTSVWESENRDVQYETFKLMPNSVECPYSEGFFDPEVGILVIMAKNKREQFTTMPRINKFGSEIFRRNKAIVDQHRVQIPVEYTISEPNEIKKFLELFAYNLDTFNIEKYLEGPVFSTKRREKMSAATL